MLRYTLIVLIAVGISATTQGFSWGRVFNNNENKVMNNGEGSKVSRKESQGGHVRLAAEGREGVERASLENVHEEREKILRVSRNEQGHEEEKRMQQFGSEKKVATEEKSNRRVEGVETSSTEKKSDGEELHPLQKEVSDRNREAGPDKVEVVGVSREREHHITDGLADAIAGLMRVYNSLVRSDSREWESSVHASVSGTRAGEVTGGVEQREEGVRVAVEEEEKKGGWGPFFVVGGIVVVAGVCVVLISFSQRERDNRVYPPRGPAYV